MLPAHGPDGGSAGARARALPAHHEHRFDQIRAAVTDLAPCIGFAVAQTLTWTRRARPFSTLNSFDRMVATCETMAHLDVVVHRGTLAAETRTDVNIFTVR